MMVGRDAITDCTYNRLPTSDWDIAKECAMQNIFAGVDVGGTRIIVGLVAEIETHAVPTRFPSRRPASGVPAGLISHRAGLSGSGASWSSPKVFRWPCDSATDSRVPSCVTTTSTRSWLARCGSAQVGIAQLSDSIADTTGAASVGEQIKIPNYECVRASQEAKC